jgi:hypothetical protein
MKALAVADPLDSLFRTPPDVSSDAGWKGFGRLTSEPPRPDLVPGLLDP